MIKVLIVEDSRVVSDCLEFIINSDPHLEVIGKVYNGKDAVDFVNKIKPDIVTMDIDMPIMNGFEATRIIMETNPLPIIVVTMSRNANEVKTTMNALAAGALSIIEKPEGINHHNGKEKRDKLISMIRILSKVKVVTRRPKKVVTILNKSDSGKKLPTIHKFRNKKLVAIGISSGGPQVLKKIFSKITGKFPYPIVVVQHITEGFLDGLVTWLGRLLMIPTHIGTDIEDLQPGHIYFAPDHHHIGIKRLKIKLTKVEPKSGDLCPSVAHLFNSLAVNHGKDTIAMILTGMGSDGAKEIKTLMDAGAITIAQDKESSLVHGMPGVAIKNGGVQYIQNPDEIANLLSEIERDYIMR